MASQAMTKMLEKAMTDEAFAQGLIDSIGEKEGDAALAAVTDFGQRNGFAVTVADAAAMQRQLIAASEQVDGDLDDDALEGVAGGVQLGVGLLGALMGGRDAVGPLGNDGVLGLAKDAGNRASSVAGYTLDAANQAMKRFVKQW